MNSTYTKSILFLLTITLLSFKAHSQCNIVANAGPDQVICAPGLVTLTGSGSGSFSNISWTPVDGVNDPASLSTSVTVSQTTTYTLTLSGGGATNNIIVDGNFSGGGVFVSDYIPGTGGPWGLLSNEGEYAVGPNPQAFHTAFQPCGDHTSGGGNMMVVNGSTTPNENVWCQTVTVQPNTLYEFSTWVASVLSSNPAELQFSINGGLLGSSFNAPSTPCQWSEFFETWNSGAATSAEICIVNQNTVAGGNDFALDDIAFGPVCNDTDEVTITVVDVDAVTEPTAILPCEFGQGINISGNGSSVGPGYTYNWATPNGSIVSGGNTLNPIVNAPGFYELTVTLTAGTTICTETASVEVVNDPDVPLAEAALPTPLSCTDPLSLLDGNGSTVGGNIEYQWTTTNGSFSGPTNELIANAATPGSYTLTVTNILNGCTDDVTVQVSSDLNFPAANPVANGNLSCANSVVTINGSGSTPSGLVFSWSTAGGNITSPTDQPSITVNAPGFYLLTVSNPANGCSDTEQVSVTANNTPPVAVIITPGSISCTTTSLSLNASSSSGSGFLSFLWSTTGGNIVSGVDSANPVVNAIGTYTVTVTQASNGCSATASVQVTGDNSLPTINIAPPSQLTCTTNQTTLSATTNGASGTIQGYNWTTTGGTIINGATTLTPLVSGTGTYTLTVTQPNGCSAVSSVQVTSNLTPPLVEAGPAPLLNCQSTTAQLNGNGSATGNGISYLWTTANGQLGNGTTTLTPTINSAGTYFITVLNAANGCSAMDSVIVLQNNNLPTAAILPPATLNCATASTVLNASSSSSGAGFTFAWTTTGGNFAAGQNTLSPTVDAAGTYILTITNTASQCTSTASVTVAANFNTPVVAIAPPVMLNCDVASQLLDATSSTLGNNSQINWTATQGGTIQNGGTTLNPLINNPGLYTLIIRDLDSQCADTVAVTVAEDVTLPVASTGPAGVLTCTTTSLNLNGNGSSQGAGFSYLWTTTNGNIVNGENTLTPLINAPGNYLLTVENTNNGCTNVAIVAVTQNGNFPSVNAGTSVPLTCNLMATNLNATADQGTQFSYLWTTADGEIVEDETTLAPLVGAPGTYVLTVTNAQNGCTSTSSVIVPENVVPPTADAGSPGVLSCSQSQLTLNGSGAAPNGSVAFNWTTLNGNIQAGEETTTPTINAPGTYILTVTNNANGCTAAASVVIAQDASLPVANAGTADDLTCVVSSVLLDASGSSQGAGFAYQWTTANGQIQGSTSTLTPTVTAPGTYLLTVTNTASNCSTISSVTVLLDNQLPTVNPGPAAQLTCATTQLQLNGNGSSSGSSFSYLWTTTNGSSITGATTLNPTITEPGLYTLSITNSLNGCAATNSVNITENTTPPAAAAAAGGLLTCASPTLNLSGNGSSTGAGFSYLWTTTNGNILNGAATLNPTVNEPGLYLLTVTNTLTGCTNTAQLTALENTTAPMANAGPTSTLTCAAPTVSLSGTGSQGAGFGYQWTATNGGSIVSGGSTLTPTVNAGGTYLLTVTNSANGCTSTSQVAIQVNQTEPMVSILPPATLTCLEETAELNGNGSSTGGQFEYAWTTTGGNFTGPQDALQTNVDAPGTYVLTITNTANGCESSSQVTVGEDVENPQVEAGQGIQLNCNETQGNLSGDTDLPIGQWAAVWTTTDGNLVAGATGLTPTVGAPGTYLLTVTNSLTGCTNTDEVIVTAVVFDDFGFEVSPPSCLNGTGVIDFVDEFGGTPPYLYSIDGGASFTTNIANGNLPPGTYELVVQDADGCELTDVAYLPEPPDVLVTLGADTLINLGDGYQLDVQTSLPDAEIATIEWRADPSLSCLDCRSPLATPRQQTDYFVKITSKEGCTAEDYLTIFVKKEVDIYVPNAFSPNNDGINDVFMIFAGGNSIQVIKSFLVFDRWGETVYQYYDFQPNNPAYSWDGKLRGLLMDPAVFVWFAEVELIDGSKRLLKGDVNLVR
ncbi:MAG: gliding motility-associated C-terminal domain-containing protein [Saprospiraceae bacterium]|nr:gliding motility-associated C-terminal domain-containing protein [Saprospiraceae bacterium]